MQYENKLLILYAYHFVQNYSVIIYEQATFAKEMKTKKQRKNYFDWFKFFKTIENFSSTKKSFQSLINLLAYQLFVEIFSLQKLD